MKSLRIHVLLYKTKIYSACRCRQLPYVMDPTNPFNNVMDASNAWEEVAERARETMLNGFGDVPTSENDWS